MIFVSWLNILAINYSYALILVLKNTIDWLSLGALTHILEKSQGDLSWEMHVFNFFIDFFLAKVEPEIIQHLDIWMQIVKN